MTKTTIIRDFQFTRDFRSIEWRATLWYNLLRATAAGLVIATAQMLLPSSKEVSALSALAVIPMMPVAYLAFIVPLSLLVSLLRSVPFVGLIGLLLAVMVAIGDPLVALLKRIGQPLCLWTTPRFSALLLSSGCSRRKSTRSPAEASPPSTQTRNNTMGLFDSFRAKSAPQFDPQRAVMTIVISALAADGEVDDEEVARMRSMCARSPLFARNSNQEDDRVIDFALGCIRQLGQGSLSQAAAALSPALRETAFAFAVEIVMADGQVGPQEESFIDELSRTLAIDDGLARAVIAVTAIRARGET